MSIKENLIEILSVPSFFNEEHQMIAKIESILDTIPGVYHFHDEYGNIYAIKGESDTYPFICAHTDTVHRIEEYSIEELTLNNGNTMLRGVKPDGKPSGCGGDNKTGITTCLELLKTQDVIKACFFFGEEFGFVGAGLADSSFFDDIGYALEFDAPDFFWVTHVCNGKQLFDPAGEFWQIAEPIMTAHTEGKKDPWNNNHPYTDLFAINGRFNFSCLNYSSGYMNMHSKDEYVIVEYVEKAITTAKILLNALGNKRYEHNTPYLSSKEFYNNDYNKKYIKFKESVDLIQQ